MLTTEGANKARLLQTGSFSLPTPEPCPPGAGSIVLTRGGKHRSHQGRGASSSECHVRRIPNKLCVHPLFTSVSPTNAGRASKGPCRFGSSLQTDKYCQESGERFQHMHQVNTQCRCEAHSKRSSSKSRRDCQRHCEKPTGELENKLPSEGV